ncbi:MAG: hypothetical protein QOI06_1684, partial [Nocardioidaceae bacterium]|nr:hypothetical protein [Nocardioidaceae bacterium]
MHDIRTVDYRLKDGIGVSSALLLLSGSYGYLSDAGTPPGADPASYQARLQTLASFAATASTIYDQDPTTGLAKYEVAREQTSPIFDAL